MYLATGQKDKEMQRGLLGKILKRQFTQFTRLGGGPLLLTLLPSAAWNTNLMAGAPTTTLAHEMLCSESHVKM